MRNIHNVPVWGHCIVYNNVSMSKTKGYVLQFQRYIVYVDFMSNGTQENFMNYFILVLGSVLLTCVLYWCICLYNLPQFSVQLLHNAATQSRKKTHTHPVMEHHCYEKACLIFLF